MKKTKEVAEAERLQAEKRAELEEAKARVKQLEIEYGLTYEALNKARRDADEPLPKCKVVSVSRGGSEREVSVGVVLRKTPTGLLVVRYFGRPEGATYKFKRSPYTGGFYDTARSGTWGEDRLELRDVPQEFCGDASDGDKKAA